MKEYLQKLNLPKNEILFLHVRLKGLDDNISYAALSNEIIEVLTELYNPKTILVPTFTYSYTKQGVYNKVTSPAEVGRFSEEIRNSYDPTFRTNNPVFNVIDTKNYLKNYPLKEESAFGEDSLMHLLHKRGHVVVNINVAEFISTYLHFLEFNYKVPYRYIKNFPGEVIFSENESKQIDYKYYVRDLDKDTAWNREKIKMTLLEEGGLSFFDFENFDVMWSHSKEIEKILGPKLEADGNFLLG